MQQQENRVYTSQNAALHQQAEAIRDSEEQMRLYRHDLRHYLNSVTALIREGKVDEALQILDHFDDLTTPTRKRYCQNTTVNAVLSFYLAKAEQAGILVDACCELPQQLPVDAIELSVVLANAIENACQALAALPPGQEKKLTLRCVGGPPLVLEIANPYCGKIAFDQNHLPCAERQGHGLVRAVSLPSPKIITRFSIIRPKRASSGYGCWSTTRRMPARSKRRLRFAAMRDNQAPP